MTESESSVRELITILKRLEIADTPKKLVNARKAFLSWHKRLRKQVDDRFPPLSGKMHRSGAFCPICRLPMQNYRRLACHMEVKHGWPRYQCACGFKKYRALIYLTHYFRNPNRFPTLGS